MCVCVASDNVDGGGEDVYQKNEIVSIVAAAAATTTKRTAQISQHPQICLRPRERPFRCVPTRGGPSGGRDAGFTVCGGAPRTRYR